jgi:predicted Zn-dependent protease
MSYLKFSRDAEREADLLGIEYEYACGYDPEEFVKFFEKLKLEDKQKHSFIARAFATHPMTTDRIERAQQEIARYLPTRDQYVVDTSEFQTVKARLETLMNAQKIDAGEGVHPTLRRREPRSQTDDNKDGNGGPTLRRKRPD